MAVKASAHITLNSVVDVKATYRYYLLQSSTLSKPSKPTENPPGGNWDDSEPTYTSGSTNSLYFVDLTVFSDDSFSYSEVSLSTAYEAAKEAYNKAQNAQDSADNAQMDIDQAKGDIENNTTKVNDAQLDIDSLKAMISTLVVGQNGESLMTQTENGWTFSLASVIETLNAASANIDNLNENATATSSAIDYLNQSVSDLGVYTDYIKFGIDNGKPCIILGETDSNFKVLITNTDIRFMEGSTTPASISNQSLNIGTAVVKDELKQGGFVWMARSNGNYGLAWRGE